jgi:putative Mn2+ efflux pump MntP
MWPAIALSFGLAMDATAVSAARGLTTRDNRELVILPAVFGGFQSLMAALGWLGGAWAKSYIERWDGPVAFGLLLLIGLKMIYDAIRGDDDDEPAPGTATVYLGLGLATSIDAAAAGLTLPLLPIQPWISVVLIGGVTAACSALGFLGGRAIGKRLGRHLGLAGGVVLIAIGINILIGSR